MSSKAMSSIRQSAQSPFVLNLELRTENCELKDERPVGGPAARAWGMEGTVIGSELGLLAVLLRSHAAAPHTGEKQRQQAALLQKAQITSDYFPSFRVAASSVDSSQGSFLAVLLPHPMCSLPVPKYRSGN